MSHHKIPIESKSTIEEIRSRFDLDVERFSDLASAQVSTIDAPLAMELIAKAAINATPNIETILDVGCGAGNNTLRLLQLLTSSVRCDLLDLSRPMLTRAEQRLTEAGVSDVRTFHGDFRTIELEDGYYDVILAAAVLHHLRDDEDWHLAFTKLFHLLKPGGSVWISDLVSHENQGIQSLMVQRYGAYLESVGGSDYREKVFAYIEQEDSPRSVTYQMNLLKKVGFSQVDILHKNATFATFGAIKAN